MFLIGSSCDGAVAGALGDPCGRDDGAGPVVTLLCPLVCVRCSRQQVQKVGRKITFLTSSPWHSTFLKFVVEISCTFCFTLAHTQKKGGVQGAFPRVSRKEGWSTGRPPNPRFSLRISSPTQ